MTNELTACLPVLVVVTAFVNAGLMLGLTCTLMMGCTTATGGCCCWCVVAEPVKVKSSVKIFSRRSKLAIL